ncbi:MAG: lipid IV(A) 3-deoxy-D-manno-octulosonic acid transferase [Wenzhouxiangellaceae bacterium]
MNRFLRLLYSFAVYLTTPVILLYLAWRGLRHPEYFRRWRERLGYATITPPPGGILVHAVSMGEVNGVSPLVRQLMAQWPQRAITFTSVTPTGSARIISSFGDQVHHCYLPIDLPGAVSRLYQQVQPALVVVMETEIWPNLFLGAASRGIPLVLVNARLSRRSASGYRRFLPQAALALGAVTQIAAQTAHDARRFVAAGADPERVTVCGNLKGDIQLSPQLPRYAADLRSRWGERRPVWLAASTHEGEDECLLSVHQQLLQQADDSLLILVPRHPERFVRVAQLAEAAGLRTARHSSPSDLDEQTQVLVVDAMGVLLNYAAAADVIFVGGSLAPLGGHNPLEPAALAKPVIMGPHNDNISDLVELLERRGGARIVDDCDALQATITQLMAQPALRQTMGQNALAVVDEQRGAVARTLRRIELALMD